MGTIEERQEWGPPADDEQLVDQTGDDMGRLPPIWRSRSRALMGVTPGRYVAGQPGPVPHISEWVPHGRGDGRS